jgi:ABC-type phosphate transport system substrate-binding protein
VVLIILGIVMAMGYVRGAFAEVAIVVNKANPATTVTKGALGRYFLKKTTMWDTDIKIAPVDLPATDPVREEFSRTILGRTPKGVESHWISQSLVGGKSAPEVVSNSALVKKHVAADSGAIGYINASDLDDSVKQVEVVD